ncbi:copper chaperone PCu(A)C [Pelistega suis]|uniref:Copper chaperone PCu(A)C n=1 Tax=Pelistega suis TaxID=1631957 RepID=A0A849P459_9BURK|nr:copper chaperone PCu(A)C [Pelistega suis]NOL50602.1 copper chaperone PCu(A)C [Pelistega suis]
MKKTLITLALTLSATVPALAQHQGHTGIHLEECIIQEPIPGKHMTGAFLKLIRHGNPVTISKVDVSSITANAELHTMTMKDNVMTMSPMTDLVVDGERIFRKGGDHVMLMQIPTDKLPKAGEKHTMTFSFTDGSTASCEAIVKTAKEVIEATKADGHQQNHHKH